MKPTDRTCRWVGRRLPLLVGSELIGVDRRRVERHLLGCDQCRERRDAAARSLALLQLVGGQSGPVEGGPSVWPALARQIRESRRPAATSGGWSNPLDRNWARFALAAGVVLVGSGVGFGLVRVGTDRPVEVVHATAGPAEVRPDASIRPGPAVEPGADAPAAHFEPFFLGLGVLELGERPTQPQSPAPAPGGPRDLALGKPAVDPFQPPATLRFDFDLEQGTIGPSGRDAQRAY